MASFIILNNTFKRFLGILFLAVAVVLLGINVYGLTQNIRPKIDPIEDLRFKNDLPLPFDQAMEQLNVLRKLDDKSQYMQLVTPLVAKSLAHIHWNEETNPDKLHQRVPIWENYVLFAVSHVTQLPDFTKYHFSSVERSIERGIGICGDASMVLSQLFEEKSIPNQIISYKGHVVVEATLNGVISLHDGDYGVSMPFSAQDVHENPSIIDYYYKSVGYPVSESLILQNIYSTPFARWNGVSHFITKKYYFEPVAYVLKWLTPAVLLVLGGLFIRTSIK